ncbi:DUF6046 domain-containing protein [Hymenobacter negativus]|uniref:DUF6046 domain-containing protein n=1 Tax=Hymenobacter negativus TaxID=2795026 RepID=A0ABS3QD45_9BACT|nr:DUF6046 domain-containing protein [Hymenobacter negativus]MBO2009167.1 hypothetical protein [Hymenobacter negativus]
MPYGLTPSNTADSLKDRGYAVGTNQASTALGGNYLPIDLRALTAEAFGYSSVRRFQLPPGQGQEGTDGFYASQAGAAEPVGLTNMFGLPVFVAVQLHSAKNPATGDYANGLVLLDPLVTVDEPFNILETPIVGRKGTVKEYINQGDYGVTIRGILATDLNAVDRMAYPLPEVKRLRDLCALGVSIPVSGWLQEVFGISNLVVKNVRYESLPGFINLQAYELQCLSDDPIELVL